MMRTVVGIANCALLAATVFAQSEGAPPADAPGAAANPTFIIADVHVSPHRAFPNGGFPIVRSGRYILRQTTMRDLVGLAYGVNPGLVREGPIWLETDRFDITAKLPPGATPDTEKLMLRALLVDRFKLAAHNDTRQMPMNTLTLGKDKVKMKQSDGSGDAGCKYVSPPQDQPQSTATTTELSCHNISMDDFVQDLRNWTYDYKRGPMYNSTGLKGTWDFDLKWSNRAQLATAGADGITIYDAVDKQLGLKLGPQPAAVPVMIVDGVNETPTPNAPDLDKILPPLPPPEFEVSTIKPSKPDQRLNGKFNGLELNFQGATLKFLIDFAWNLNPNDDEALANAPKWLDSDHIDIDAKLGTDPDGKPPMVDDEDFRRLLRELLTDRFQIKMHTEDRPVDAYTLIAVNPKLRKADPTSHMRCGEDPGPDGIDPRIENPVLNRLVTCQNMTLAQMCDKFQEIASGYIYNPVLDKTGITGRWDFTLSFSSAGVGGGSVGATPPADGTTTPPEPIGAVSFFDAVNKQLGLKLEKQKRPLPVLVIDQIEEKPTEN
jgi:uncharacterized protein (TIGR03435 family)